MKDKLTRDFHQDKANSAASRKSVRTPQSSRNSVPWFRRHKYLTLIGINLSLLLGLALILEFVLMITIPYNPGYYHAFNNRSESTEYEFEWGIVKINSLGFADDEFDLSKEVRIGYVGDSVTNGVGCGYGYRFTELLENEYPDFLHANLGKSGSSITSLEGIERTLEVAKQLGLTTVVSALNLNDIVPDSYGGKDKDQPGARRSMLFVKHYLDWLRGRSYLYTYLRTACKSMLMKRGIGIQGYPMAELFPSQYEDTIRQTAGRVNRLKSELEKMNIEFIVLILPYEMQISESAAKTYASHEVNWSPDFISGATQEMLIKYFDDDIRYFDLLDAFVDPSAREQSREGNEVGEYFVYDKGDRLDWNHPNRKGHRRIAEYLIRRQIFSDHDSDSPTNTVCVQFRHASPPIPFGKKFLTIQNLSFGFSDTAHPSEHCVENHSLGNRG